MTNFDTVKWTTLSPDSTESTQDQKIFLIYGPSGTGKTTLSVNIKPKDSVGTLVLGCDPGKLGGSLSIVPYKPKFLKIQTYSQLINLLPDLRKHAGTEFDVLVVDSMTYLSNIVMAEILESVKREIPRFEEWNLNATRIRRLINSLVDIGTHVIFTAIDDISKEETTGKMFGGPNLPGKLSKELPQACDVVIKLYAQSSFGSDMKRQVNYRFQSVPDDIWFARDRTNKLPADASIGTISHGVNIAEITRLFGPIF